MGAVVDRLDLTLEEAKDFLRVDTDDDDVLIELLIDAAKEDADEFLGNPFEDEDGDPLDIPSAVKLWCLGRVARRYEHRTEGVEAQSDAAGSVQWGEDEYRAIFRWRRNPGF